MFTFREGLDMYSSSNGNPVKGINDFKEAFQLMQDPQGKYEHIFIIKTKNRNNV